ncbi:MAG: hypothetical protein ACHQ4H_04975, partial [Ktedonobacterales bacterium]
MQSRGERARALIAPVRAWAATPGGRVWVDAGWIWLVTRALFVALTVLVPGLLIHPAAGQPDPLHRWGTQDGYLFTLVAAQGYHVWWHAMMWPAIPGLEH